MKHLAVLVLLLAACGDAAGPGDTSPVPTTPAPTTVTPTTVPAPDEVIVEVHIGGGLCVDGPCSTTYTILGDGRVQINGADSSLVGTSDLATLLDQLSVGSGDLSLFTGTCPEAYDGPRYTYRFQDTEIDSCVSDVTGSELIRLIHASLQFGSPYG